MPNRANRRDVAPLVQRMGPSAGRHPRAAM